MAADIRCPRCGAANRPGTAFCVNCGSPLAAGGTETSPTAAYPSAPPPAYAAGYGAPFDSERQRQINRTRTGVLLLLIGTLLSWVPFIGILGSLLVLIGAILVILGRKAFGTVHSRNVIISVVLFFLAIIIAFVGALVAIASTFAGFAGEITPAQIQAAFNGVLIVLVIAAVVGGLANVFFTFALQKQMGKILLLAGYVAAVITSIAIFAVVAGAMSALIATACPGGTCADPAAVNSATFTFQGQVAALGLLSAIPSILYAAAYYLAWNRIKSGEIPGSAMPPGMGPQPAMPMPPR